MRVLPVCIYYHCAVVTLAAAAATDTVIDIATDPHIYILDAVLPVRIVSNHVDTDKLTTANGGTFASSSASLSSQSR